MSGFSASIEMQLALVMKVLKRVSVRYSAVKSFQSKKAINPHFALSLKIRGKAYGNLVFILLKEFQAPKRLLNLCTEIA